MTKRLAAAARRFFVYQEDTFRPFDKRACSKNASRLKNSIWMTCQNEFLLHATMRNQFLKSWNFDFTEQKQYCVLGNGGAILDSVPSNDLYQNLFKLLLVECRFYWCYQFFLKTTHYLSTKYFHLKPFFTGHEKIFEGWIGLQFKSMFTFLLLNLLKWSD